MQIRWLVQTIDVINVFYVFYSGHVFYVFFTYFKFYPRFLLLKKRCQMQSINMSKSNEKYS